MGTPVDENTTTTMERIDITFRLVRDGYLTGRTALFGHSFEVEAFRVHPDRWNEPDNKRPQRLSDVIHGLMIDDVPLNQVPIPGHEGRWILVMYPAEDEHYKGSPK